MGKIYRLEMYHYGEDYWSTVGVFERLDLARVAKEMIEKNDSMVKCSIFEEQTINDIFFTDMKE